MSKDKNGQEVAKKKKPTSFSKEDRRHWEQKVTLPNYTYHGKVKQARFYAVRIQAHGERRKVSLVVSQKRQAADKALELYRLIKAGGWGQGLAEFRGERPAKKSDVTLGEYLAAVGDARIFKEQTFATHRTKLRTIAAEIASDSIPTAIKAKRNDHTTAGNEAWRRAVEEVSLSIFSEGSIKEWLRARRRRGETVEEKDSALRTANSCLRSGKALFKPDVIDEVKDLFELPSPLPFRDLKIREPEVSSYVSEFSPQALIVAAQRELAQADRLQEAELYREKQWKGFPKPWPDLDAREKEIGEQVAFRKREAFKVFILGLVAGLRRAEIDCLTWGQIDFETGVISIRKTRWFEPKTKRAVRDIPIEPEFASLMRSWMKGSRSEFVLDGPEPNKERVYSYRADKAQCELVAWLRSKGVTARNAIHALRKEAGSLVCEQAGIHAASALLGHAQIQTTVSHYVESRSQQTVGLGGSLLKKGGEK